MKLSSLGLILVSVAACSGDDRATRSAPLPPGSIELPPPPPKVIAIHVPGLDPETLDRGIREDYLPHLRRLRVEGTVIPIGAGGSGEFFTGIAGQRFATPSSSFVSATELVNRPATDRLPAMLPRFEVLGTDAGVLAAVAGAGHDVIALGAPLSLVRAGVDRMSVLASDLPAASFDPGSFLFVSESKDGSASERAVPGGRVVTMPATSSTDESALFVVEVDGPRLAPDQAPLRARLEIRTARDRMSGEVRTRDDSQPFRAGRFAVPVRLRFDLAADLVLYARIRVYVRPLGTERLEAYVDPVEFDPILPPEWERLSAPPDYAAQLERRHGVLPRLGPGAFPRAALAAGLLDARDAAAALDAMLAAERELLSGIVVDGQFKALFFETKLVEAARWFDSLPRHTAADRDEPLVEFARQRVPLSRVLDSVAGAVDRMIGDVLARVDKRERRESISLLVAATNGDATSGTLAMTRLAYDVEPGRPLVDVAATAAALLEVSCPPNVNGRALPLGNPMERLPESKFTVIPHREPDVSNEP